MRAVVVAGLVLLGGCTTMREVAGKYNEIAEKGIGINTATMGESVTPSDAVESSDKGPPLPTGLGGDKANANYAPVPPQ